MWVEFRYNARQRKGSLFAGRLHILEQVVHVSPGRRARTFRRYGWWHRHSLLSLLFVLSVFLLVPALEASAEAGRLIEIEDQGAGEDHDQEALPVPVPATATSDQDPELLVDGPGPGPVVLPVRQPPVRWASTYAWQFHNNDPASLHRGIDLAAERGVTQVQLSHEIINQADDLFRRPGLPGLIRSLARHAHARGIQLYIWTREFHGGPSWLAERPDMDGPRFWDWIRQKYRRVYDLVPEVDGLVLTLHEVDVPIYIDDRVASRMSAPDRVARLLAVMDEVGRQRGKKLIVRTFVGRPEHLPVVVEGIGRSPPTVAVMSKDVPGDYGWRQPFAPEVGALPDREHLVELDLAHEYFGQSLVPFLYPQHLARRLQWMRSAGARGVVARIEREGHSVLGTLSELNLLTLEKLLADPDHDAEDAWRESVRERTADPTGRLADILQRTEAVVEKTFLVQGFYFLNNHSRVPELPYAHSHLWENYLPLWVPSLQPAHQALLHPSLETYRQVVEEKDEAVRMAERNLQEVEGMRTQLPPSSYSELVKELTRERDAAILWRAMADAYFAHSRLRIARRDPVLRAMVEQRIAALEAVADEIGRRWGPSDWLLSRQRARQFANALRYSL